MSNDNNDEQGEVSVVEDTEELDQLNTVRVNFSVPPNSSILVISPHEDGMLFQRHSTVTPDTVDTAAVSASNLLSTILWTLANKQGLYQDLFKEMVKEDWTIEPVAGHA